MAFHDVLTGLPNRDLLRDRLDQLVQQGRANGGVHAVISADLNRFKTVNEDLGQTFGDAVLRQVAERLGRLVSDFDTVARVGGDEFVVLLTGRGAAGECAVLADAVVAALTRPYVVGGKEFRLGASVGVALFPADGESGTDLLRRADGARQVAKQRGGGYQFYQSDVDQAVRRRLRLEIALGEAAEKGDFTLEFQPKVSLLNGEIDGVEALLRWRTDEFGAVSPAAFIPMAEETGAITRIGEWVLRQSCLQAERFRQTGLPLSVAANVSAKQMLSGDLPRRVATLLKETGLAPELLQLELTESSVILDQDSTIAQLAALREMGVRTALDDFGTGYSSLSYLRHLPIDYLKIDRSFVMHLETDETDVTVVGGIVAMGHALGLKIIAEGIESEGQSRILRKMGCDLGQGYLFSQPLPPQRLGLWVGARRAIPDRLIATG
jgi:diguanylate cyclase (GGDEF)-like protein